MLAARAPDLRRFTAVLTGELTGRDGLAGEALAEVWRRGRVDPDRVDERLHSAAVQRWLRRTVRRRRFRPAVRARPALRSVAQDEAVDVRADARRTAQDEPAGRVWPALAALAPTQRALLVLCTYDGLDPREAAVPVGLSPRRAATETRAALLVIAAATGLPVQRVPHAVLDTLRETAARVPPIGDPLDAMREHVVTASRRVRRRALAGAGVGAVVTMLVAASTLAGSQRQPAVTPAPVSVADGLLAWPTRGSLAGEDLFRDSALEVWRRVQPFTRPHPLFLGVIGSGRVAVLEGLAGGGAPYVAVVAEHGPKDRTVLRLDSINRLGDPALPMLVIPYDGNTQIPGLTPAPLAFVQALVAPRVTRLERRAPEGVVYDVPLRAGLSATWLSEPRADRSRGIVRAYRGGQLIFDGYVPLNDVAVQPVASTRVAPPWPLLGDAVDDRRLRDDAVLFAARNAWSRVQITVMWAGRLPDGSLARLEVASSTNPVAAQAGLIVAREGEDALGPVRNQRTYGLGSDVVWAGPAGPDRPFVVAVARPGVTRLTYGVGGNAFGHAAGRVLVATSCGSCPARLRGYSGSGRLLFSVVAPT